MKRRMLLGLLTSSSAMAQNIFNVGTIEKYTAFRINIKDVGSTIKSFTSIEINDEVKIEHTMLEINADSRSIKFTAKEVMDILEGKA